MFVKYLLKITLFGKLDFNKVKFYALQKTMWKKGKEKQRTEKIFTKCPPDQVVVSRIY